MWFKPNWQHLAHGFVLDWLHPLPPHLTGNFYLLVWQLCALPTSGCPTSNSPSTASVELSQPLFSHNSGSAELSFTNRKKKEPIISMESSIATGQQLCRTYGSYAELPIANLMTGGENEWSGVTQHGFEGLGTQPRSPQPQFSALFGPHFPKQ